MLKPEGNNQYFNHILSIMLTVDGFLSKVLGIEREGERIAGDGLGAALFLNPISKATGTLRLWVCAWGWRAGRLKYQISVFFA